MWENVGILLMRENGELIFRLWSIVMFLQLWREIVKLCDNVCDIALIWCGVYRCFI